MSQSLHTKSLAAVRVLRWIAFYGLIGACASSVVWSISPARSDGKSEDKSTGSITANPNPPPPLPNQKGRLTSMGNGQKRTAYEYDALGRGTRTVHNFDGQSQPFTTAYGYPQNQVSATGLGIVPSSQIFPDNERVDYTYDSGGAQQSIKTTPSNGPQQTIISSILRNSRGQTIRAVYGNNAVTTYGYNDATNLRLNEIKTVAGAQTLQDYTYSFDNVGNVTGIADIVTPSLNATYGYDSLDQLISMTPAGQALLAYTYDRIGNLTAKEGTTQTYYTGGLGHGPHALATSGGLSYNYDNNGNLSSTSNGINTLTNITWNSENMPTKVVQSGTTIYQKFFVGESLWKKVEPSVTTYYLPSMRIENGQVRKFFAGFAERSPDGSLEFYHDDHLGSASLVTNLAGAMVTRKTYMPYGSDRYLDPNSTFTPEYQFNFKEKESTGFYDYGARLYNPATGRWLSPDPFTFDGSNRYSYVRNNPLLYRDVNGKWTDLMHDLIVANAFGMVEHAFVSESLGNERAFIVGQIQGGSRFVDHHRASLPVTGTGVPTFSVPGPATLDPHLAYQHAMWGAYDKSPADARNKTEAFIINHIAKAHDLQRAWAKSGHTGLSPKALRQFGKAMHPVMDATSPRHIGYQYYDGVPRNISEVNAAFDHARGESSITPDQLSINKHLIQFFFATAFSQDDAQRVFGEKVDLTMVPMLTTRGWEWRNLNMRESVNVRPK